MNKATFTANEVADIITAARTEEKAYLRVIGALGQLRDGSRDSLNRICTELSVTPVSELDMFDFWAGLYAHEDGTLQKMIAASAELCCKMIVSSAHAKGAATNWKLLRALQTCYATYNAAKIELNALLKASEAQPEKAKQPARKVIDPKDQADKLWETSKDPIWMLSMISSTEGINMVMEAASRALFQKEFKKYDSLWLTNDAYNDAKDTINGWVGQNDRDRQIICAAFCSVFPTYTSTRDSVK